MTCRCPHCGKNTHTYQDETTGAVSCVDCGRLISQEVFTQDTTFIKGADGSTRASGHLVQLGREISQSYLRTIDRGNLAIREIIERNGISGCDHAKKYYQIAVDRGFTRGRRIAQIAAACVYIACREQEKPFLLIEFSSDLGVSVYELGTVYLQLCQLFSLKDHPFIQKPVDPSLYMHRYTRGLLGENNNKNVLNTALRLAVSMKRDWMQTGRKPSGICAAAIYVSSLLHGYKFKKTDVVKVVHICEATLTKRLIEFENTKAGSLTIEEFNQNAEDYEKEMRSCKQPSTNDLKMPGETEVVCQHKSSAVQSGFGLCKNCYMEFCGGLDGLEPPAFQRAEIQRLANESAEVVPNESAEVVPNESAEVVPNESAEVVQCASPISGKLSDTQDAFESSKDVSDNDSSVDETHTLSEIDDSEVSCYLNNKEESEFKKIIWELQNKEYMQEQAIKEAASKLTPEETKAKEALKKKAKANKELEAKNAKPPQTAAEAVGQHFTKKRLSSKINYDALDSIFGDEPSAKKNRPDDDAANVEESGNENNEMNDAGSVVEEEEEDEMEDDYENETQGDEWNYNKYNHEQEMDGYSEEEDFGF